MKNKVITLEQLEFNVLLNEKANTNIKPKQKTIDDYFNVRINKRENGWKATNS